MKTLLLLLVISLCPIILLSQSLDVEGQAKISVMNSDPTAQDIVVRQADGTLAIRNASTLTDGDADPINELELPQSPNPGEMVYWDGIEWVSITSGIDGQNLTLCAGIPTWTTDGICPPPGVTSVTGVIWMDKNLGATQVATSSTDPDSYGDLYQWGRDTDGHQIRTSGTTLVLSTTDNPGHGDFIKVGSSSPYDWRSGQNNNLWQGLNGLNNPCPSGYRLPTEAEWDQERLTWTSNNSAGAFASPLKLPVAGYRAGSNGGLNSLDNYGFYWSSTVSGIESRYLRFYGSDAGMLNFSRSTGVAVRCLKD